MIDLPIKFDRNKHRYAETQPNFINPGGVALDEPCIFQPCQPPCDGRGAEPDRITEPLDRHPTIIGRSAQHWKVKFIDITDFHQVCLFHA